MAIPLLKAETQDSQSREVGSFSICTIVWLKPPKASKIINANGESGRQRPRRSDTAIHVLRKDERA